MGQQTDLTNIMEEPASSLGSVSWIRANDYDEGDEFHERATKFFASVKWDVLASHASTIRNGIPYNFGEKFSISLGPSLPPSLSMSNCRPSEPSISPREHPRQQLVLEPVDSGDQSGFQEY